VNSTTPTPDTKVVAIDDSGSKRKPVAMPPAIMPTTDQPRPLTACRAPPTLRFVALTDANIVTPAQTLKPLSAVTSPVISESISRLRSSAPLESALRRAIW